MSRLLRIAFDLALVVAATVLAIVLRTDLDLPSPAFVRYVPYLSATVLISLMGIGVIKLDVGFWRYASLRDILSVIGIAALTAAGSTAAIFGINRLEGIARTIPVLQFVLIIVMLLTPRLVARCSAGRGRTRVPFRTSDRADPVQNVLVVGFNVVSDLYLRCLAETGDETTRVAGLIGLKKGEVGRYVGQLPILGVLEDLPRILSDLVVHGIVVNRIVFAVAPGSLSPSSRQLLTAVQRDHALTFDLLANRIAGCEISARGSRTGVPRADWRVQERCDVAADSPFDLVELQTLAAARYWHLKRAVDIAGAAGLIILLAPLGLLVAALVAADVGVPLIFWQVRLGTGSVPFKLFKFRTMAAAYDPRGVRIPDDERLSVLGALLRRSRLDELPQLWNVLVGDMSLIGPRPLLPVDQPSFESGRLLVRPGVTGWAQVCGGRDISANTKAALDVWYIRNASLKIDIQILLATIRMAVVGERVESSKIECARAALARETAVGLTPGLRVSTAGSLP